ncbi:MAG: helix-turn-helix domain-containing protein [Pyrinomonadaceae bacterium MAG19_C2-C3]|nr:helix-turn-helix domain-containing protein [Pyrinomonadaceae bacterium MAG19_C2-C3]
MKNASPVKPTRLAAKLQQLRLSLGLSQTEMLNRLGYGDKLFRSNVSQYELGTREPALGVLLAYARAANVIVDVLIDDALDLPEKLPSKHKHSGITRVVDSNRSRRITIKQKPSP